MTLWKRAMDYLGLGPEDAYDDYDMPYEPEPQRGPRGPRPQQGGWDQEPQRGRPRGGWDDEYPPQRPAPSRVSARDLDPVPPRRPSVMEPGDPSGLTVRPPRNTVMTAAPRQQHASANGEPFTLRPRRFDQAQELADKFKEGLPVIMNLEGTERDVSRRLIDFASGLCYALSGTMEKVATGVYLLKPQGRGGYNDGYGE